MPIVTNNRFKFDTPPPITRTARRVRRILSAHNFAVYARDVAVYDSWGAVAVECDDKGKTFVRVNGLDRTILVVDLLCARGVPAWSYPRENSDVSDGYMVEIIE